MSTIVPGRPFIQAAVLLILICVGLAACRSEEKRERQPSEEGTNAEWIRSGRKSARVHCQSCHKLPQPEHLDKQTWKQVVLPRMGHRLGIYEGGKRPDSLIGEGEGGRVVREANVFPKEPQLSRDEWRSIVTYYVQEAPEELPSPPSHPELGTGLDQFRLHTPLYRQNQPLTTLVSAEDTALYVGTAGGNTGGRLAALESDMASAFREKRTLDVSSPPAAMRIDGSDLYLTLMGQLSPTDRPDGQIVKRPLHPEEDERRSSVTLIDDLQRPVHAAYADLTGDGREDIVVSEFGFRTGRLSWFEKVGKQQFERHVLRDRPGAIKSVIRDFTGNGRPDIMTLMAQGDEGIYLFRNRGKGQFEAERLLRFPPSYGSSSFEVVDFNGDGELDILHTAGDNADFAPVMRPYHGVRIFLNDGANNFERAYFYPMNGTYGAVAKDFDRDGDVDIAAVSFFPDYEKSGTESFVYLENKGNLEFEASTFQESALGRWLVLDSGDLDRDGDQDLVLGSFSATNLGTSYIPERLRELWQRNGYPIVVLENTTPVQ